MTLSVFALVVWLMQISRERTIAYHNITASGQDKEENTVLKRVVPSANLALIT